MAPRPGTPLSRVERGHDRRTAHGADPTSRAPRQDGGRGGEIAASSHKTNPVCGCTDTAERCSGRRRTPCAVVGVADTSERARVLRRGAVVTSDTMEEAARAPREMLREEIGAFSARAPRARGRKLLRMRKVEHEPAPSDEARAATCRSRRTRWSGVGTRMAGLDISADDRMDRAGRRGRSTRTARRLHDTGPRRGEGGWPVGSNELAGGGCRTGAHGAGAVGARAWRACASTLRRAICCNCWAGTAIDGWCRAHDGRCAWRTRSSVTTA